MGLMQLNEMGWNKIETAIEVIRQNATEPYYVTNSGGKDSTVLRDLVLRSEVAADFHYNVSPIDPPEVYQRLKTECPETKWEYQCKNFWGIVDKKGLPTRTRRWCCEKIKEGGGSGRIVLTGIRWAESARRSQRCMIEPDRKDKSKRYLHPIICWSDAEVWEYIHLRHLTFLTLYAKGWTRVGCIGCPMSSNQKRELANYPKIAYLWKTHGAIFFNTHEDNETHKLLGTPENFWNWWLSGKSVKNYLNEQQSKF
jgi:phosphoadenosine phosphosulfate reductase